MICYISIRMKKMQKLLFIYNANSGTRNALLDGMHKVFRPQTYDCKLCNITFGVIAENKTWKRFRKESQYPMVFLHKDEFAVAYKSKFGYKFTFPIVLSECENGLEVLIATKELNQLKSDSQLKSDHLT